MNANWFYKDDFTIGAAFAPANNVSIGVKVRNIKMIASGADASFSVDGGATVAGVCKSGETLDFTDVNIGQIQFRGAGASVRFWGWDGE